MAQYDNIYKAISSIEHELQKLDSLGADWLNNYKKKDSVLRWFSVAWYVASIPGIIQEIMIQTILSTYSQEHFYNIRV